MDNNQICKSAKEYIAKKCKEYEYTNLGIHSINIRSAEDKWTFEAEISYKYKLHGWEKDVKTTVIGVLVDDKWVSPDFNCEN